MARKDTTFATRQKAHPFPAFSARIRWFLAHAKRPQNCPGPHGFVNSYEAADIDVFGFSRSARVGPWLSGRKGSNLPFRDCHSTASP
jgi:hypothetical protein